MPAFKKPKLAGAPTKCTQEIIDRITNLLRAGSYIETAASAVGISRPTFQKWLKKGSKEGCKNIYGALVCAVEKAVADAQVRDLMNIDKAAMGLPVFAKTPEGKLILDENENPIVTGYLKDPDWKASAWRLERRNPKEWGRFERVESNNVNVLIPPQVVFSLPPKKPLPDEE